jgi:hypothetical protein
MTRHIASLVLAVFGLLLLAVASGSNAVSLAETDLAIVTGGADCEELDPFADTESGCTDCLSDGNGGSVKCSTNQNSNGVRAHSGEHTYCADLQPFCGGIAYKYRAGITDCSGMPSSTEACGRHYVFWSCGPKEGDPCP